MQDTIKKILVVDDDPSSQALLKVFLERDGYAVYLADNGQEAIALFQAEQPDLVLMDVLMPVMDGYQAAWQIKALSGENLVPVIFLTAVEGDQELVKCLECGGDDFLTKPFNKFHLKARINAWIRNAGLTAQVRHHRDKLAYERRLIEEILLKIRASEQFDHRDIRYLMAPVETTTGDLLLSAIRPDGVRHILLGDATGHGLIAALVAPTVSDSFYRMTRKGYPLELVLAEINHKLHYRLPIGMFLAVCALEADPYRQTLAVWNGGLPDMLIYRDGHLRERISSANLALGICGDRSFRQKPVLVRVKPGDRIFVYSDGVTEACNPAGDMLGQNRLEELLAQLIVQNESLEVLRQNLEGYRGGTGQADDITMVEFTFPAVALSSLEPVEEMLPSQRSEAADWQFDAHFGPESLRSPDLVSDLVALLMQCEGLQTHYAALFTVLQELLANAIQHGVLAMDPSLKTGENGLEIYRDACLQALRHLEQGGVTLHVAHYPLADGGEVFFSMVDSGHGCEPEERRNSRGMGLHLVQSVCHGLEFHGRGNGVDAVYRYRTEESK